MTVTPFHKFRLEERQDFYQFLTQISADLTQKHHSTPPRACPSAPVILNLSFPVEMLDPLQVIQHFAATTQPLFYFEKRAYDAQGAAADVAIAAIGRVATLPSTATPSFAAARQFLRQTLTRIHVAGDRRLPFAGPHFIGSFPFFPEATADGGPTLFLPRWQVTRQGDRCTVVANVPLEGPVNVTALTDYFWQTLQTIRARQPSSAAAPTAPRPLLRVQDVRQPQAFQQAVAQALTAIERQQLQKVVLAHAVDVVAPQPFDLVASLRNLRSRYPHCYLFALRNGAGPTFLGASPERLVRVGPGPRLRRQLTTDALAGSAPRGHTPCEDATLASELLTNAKEMREHQAVTEFILHQLETVGLQAEAAPRRLLQLSNIQHLHTPITADLPADRHVLDLLRVLHPTPAVAGMPRDAACEYIQQHEPFARSRYAAPIGWVDRHGNGEFAVGIRSALIDQAAARLYAGAGIVAGSQPQREWAEVQLKLRALLATLA